MHDVLLLNFAYFIFEVETLLALVQENSMNIEFDDVT